LTNTDLNTITLELGNKGRFSKTELRNVLEKLYPGRNENTLRWKIHDLKEKGAINHVTRGVYTLNKQKRSYLPEIPAEAKKLYKNIRKELPYAEFSIAQTGWFNEFMLHQVFRTYLVLEVEREAAVSVFNRLSEQGKRVFLDPDRKTFDLYVSHAENSIIVKPLISESPLMELDDIKIASLEKLLVDCICDTEIYSAQYQEVDSIFKRVMEKYTINIGRLKRYSRRRNKTEKVAALMNINRQDDRQSYI
jgi:predicted transcriptional regulator of viral defense system